MRSDILDPCPVCGEKDHLERVDVLYTEHETAYLVRCGECSTDRLVGAVQHGWGCKDPLPFERQRKGGR